MAAWVAPVQGWLISTLTGSVAWLAQLPGMSVQVPGFPSALALPYAAGFVIGVMRLRRAADHWGRRLRASTKASAKS